MSGLIRRYDAPCSFNHGTRHRGHKPGLERVAQGKSARLIVKAEDSLKVEEAVLHVKNQKDLVGARDGPKASSCEISDAGWKSESKGGEGIQELLGARKKGR
jgi:hypothetical protein